MNERRQKKDERKKKQEDKDIYIYIYPCSLILRIVRREGSLERVVCVSYTHAHLTNFSTRTRNKKKKTGNTYEETEHTLYKLKHI